MKDGKLIEDDIIWFGKHKGRTFRYLVNLFPGYLKWCTMNIEDFVLEESLQAEMEYRLYNRCARGNHKQEQIVMETGRGEGKRD